MCQYCDWPLSHLYQVTPCLLYAIALGTPALMMRCNSRAGPWTASGQFRIGPFVGFRSASAVSRSFEGEKVPAADSCTATRCVHGLRPRRNLTTATAPPLLIVCPNQAPYILSSSPCAHLTASSAG